MSARGFGIDGEGESKKDKIDEASDDVGYVDNGS